MCYFIMYYALLCFLLQLVTLQFLFKLFKHFWKGPKLQSVTLPSDDVVDLKSSFLQSHRLRTSFVAVLGLISVLHFSLLRTTILMRQRSGRFPEDGELNPCQMILDLQCSLKNAKDRSEQGENCHPNCY